MNDFGTPWALKRRCVPSGLPAPEIVSVIFSPRAAMYPAWSGHDVTSAIGKVVPAHRIHLRKSERLDPVVAAQYCG